MLHNIKNKVFTTVLFLSVFFIGSCDEEEIIETEAQRLEQILINNIWHPFKNTIEIQSDCIGDTSIFGQKMLDFTEQKALEFIKLNGERVISYGDIDRINWVYNHEQKEIALNTLRSSQETLREIVFTDVEITDSLLKYIYYEPPSFVGPVCDNTEHKALMEFQPNQ